MKIIRNSRSFFYNQDFKNVYLPFIWHGFFLAITMAMIEMNTVLPSLISKLTNDTVVFGGLYSIMLGAPLVFNLLFSSYIQKFKQKKSFLLFGICMRSIIFFGMAIVTLIFGLNNPVIVLISFYFLIFLFSISGGFAGIAYSDIVGKLLPTEKRGEFYALKQFISGIASLIGGFFIAWIFKPNSLQFPMNYVISFFIGGIGLLIATMGFWKLKEPIVEVEKNVMDEDKTFMRDILDILKVDKTFLRFIITENITSFSLMILPFYMVFIKNSFTNYVEYIGAFIISQVIGGIASNFLWGYVSVKFGSKIVIKLCIFMGAMLPILALLVKPLGVQWYVIIFLFVGFVTSGRHVGFDSYILDISPDEKRILYLGIRGTLNILVVLLPLAGGIFINLIGYNLTFGLVSLFMVFAYYSVK